jgi:hypothetical protein
MSALQLRSTNPTNDHESNRYNSGAILQEKTISKQQLIFDWKLQALRDGRIALGYAL